MLVLHRWFSTVEISAPLNVTIPLWKQFWAQCACVPPTLAIRFPVTSMDQALAILADLGHEVPDHVDGDVGGNLPGPGRMNAVHRPGPRPRQNGRSQRQARKTRALKRKEKALDMQGSYINESGRGRTGDFLLPSLRNNLSRQKLQGKSAWKKWTTTALLRAGFAAESATLRQVAKKRLRGQARPVLAMQGLWLLGLFLGRKKMALQSLSALRRGILACCLFATSCLMNLRLTFGQGTNLIAFIRFSARMVSGLSPSPLVRACRLIVLGKLGRRTMKIFVGHRRAWRP